MDEKILMVGNKTYNLNNLSESERHKLEDMKILENQEEKIMRFEMIFLLFLFMIFNQIILIKWRQKHIKSYRLATLIGIWIVPIIISLCNFWIRFIIIWIAFSILTGIMVFIATRKPLPMSSPSLVYTWFLLMYRLSYLLAIIGYMIVMSTIFHLNVLFMIETNSAMDYGLLITFYGLYFGVLGRDLSSVCSDKMAAQIGYYSPSGIPTKILDQTICAICGNKLISDDRSKTYKLNCNHTFHDFCIRGWCIIGKKQTCPYCRERVDLQRMFKNPWEKPHLLHGSLLDGVRYFLAWQPLFFLIVHLILKFLGVN